MHLSTVERRGAVFFPEFTGERVYMRSIYHGQLPPDLSRWDATIAGMLAGMVIPELMFLMVDQRVLQAGEAHRRPGVHVDGYWLSEPAMHGGEAEPRHGSEPEPPKKPTRKLPPFHRPTPRHGGDSKTWATSTFSHPEALLLASNVVGCRAFVGTCHGGVSDGGNCDAVDLSHMDAVTFEAGRCYAGTVGTIHESIPVVEACQRTVVRLNIPNQN